MTHDEIKIGISACVLGAKVRFDGQHKRDAYLTDTLAQFVSFVPVCPEVDIGMGIPRETVRLIRDDDKVRMVAPKSGVDYTDKMTRYARKRVKEFAPDDLCGFILKKDSPSCGMERVRVYGAKGTPSRNGRGLFAAALIEEYPYLPVEEEGRLRDPRLRENFFERVFAYRRLKSAFSGRWTLGRIVDFHSREKLLLLAHHTEGYRELGRLVAHAKGRPRPEFASEYQELFMASMHRLATRRKHRNVLQHILGYFKKTLPSEQRLELVGLIDDFVDGLIPLVVPMTLARHFVQKQGVEYLQQQTYLSPHPKELMLRNHV